MNAAVVKSAAAAAPHVLAELAARGLQNLVVEDLGAVWVESAVHGLPVPLHDVDDVRWFAADVEGVAGR